MKQEVQVKAHISIEVDCDVSAEDLGQVIIDMLATMVIDEDTVLCCVQSASFIEEAGIYSDVGGWNNITVGVKNEPNS